MRVLVTGGLGYVGGVVALRLVQAGHQVAVLTRGRGGRPPPAGAVTLVGDLRDPDRVRELVAGFRPEAACHLGGLVRVRDSFADPVGYHATNVGGTANLLGALAAHAERAGRPAQVVLASAAAVGRHGDGDRSRLLPMALAVADGREAVMAVHGDGSATREYTHVADVAEAYLLALGAARAGRPVVYNVGSGTSASVREVLAAVERVTGRRLAVDHRPAGEEPWALLLDSGRIRRELGWRPARPSLEGMVADAWAWQRAASGYGSSRWAIGTGSTRSARSKPNTRP